MFVSNSIFLNNESILYWKAVLSISLSNFDDLISIGDTSIIFKINQIPVNGSCNVDLLDGRVLESYFTIKCFDWIDNDGKIVKYEYFGKFFTRNLENQSN